VELAVVIGRKMRHTPEIEGIGRLENPVVAEE
jgi:hypothetical protein